MGAFVNADVAQSMRNARKLACTEATYQAFMTETSPLDEKRCLVTGGAGYLGRHLVAALRAKGCPVHVLDTAPSPEPQSGVRWFQGDVRRASTRCFTRRR
jgi:5,10-methylene-tetrahydrofolate dehydrogenase/methenyl tetrahydrofolate cyclohydrolase